MRYRVPGPQLSCVDCSMCTPPRIHCFFINTDCPSQYYLINQAVWFIVIAPYISLPQWKQNFVPPNLHSSLSPVWSVSRGSSRNPCLTPYLQVFVVSGCFRIHEYGIVACGPVYGPLPTSLSYDNRPSLFDHRRKHGICEFPYGDL